MLWLLGAPSGFNRWDSESSKSMTRIQFGVTGQLVSGDAVWRGVSLRKPCPVCGSGEGCFLHEDAEFASCAKNPSDWPLTNGTWLHRVIELEASELDMCLA